MATTAARGFSWTLPAVFAALAAAAPVPALPLGLDLDQAAAPAPTIGTAAAPSRLRAADATAAALLRAGMARSATFRAIVETLEGSDLIIYIEARPIRLPGQLQFLAASPGCRHVRVSVRTPGLDTELVAWLGHELWHAVELAEAPDVRNQAGLLRLYQRIGMAGASGTTAETAKAQEVWTTVLYEARARGRTR
jgi:hypothetical protein